MLRSLEQELKETKLEGYIRGRKYLEQTGKALIPTEQMKHAFHLIVSGEEDFQQAFVEWFVKGYTSGLLKLLAVSEEEPQWYQPYSIACQFLGTHHLQKGISKIYGNYDLYWTTVGLYHPEVIARWGDYEEQAFKGIPSLDQLRYTPEHPLCVAFRRAKQIGFFKRNIKIY